MTNRHVTATLPQTIDIDAMRRVTGGAAASTKPKPKPNPNFPFSGEVSQW